MAYSSKEKQRQYNKRYYQKNRVRILQHVRQHTETHREERERYILSPRGRFAVCKTAAKTRGIDFLLTFDEFLHITMQPCVFCGVFNHGREFSGIDRIDSTAGYSIDNCQPCCSKHNLMKGSLALEEFIQSCAEVAERWKSKH